jgi:hypothetical protein
MKKIVDYYYETINNNTYLKFFGYHIDKERLFLKLKKRYTYGKNSNIKHYFISNEDVVRLFKQFFRTNKDIVKLFKLFLKIVKNYKLFLKSRYI